MAYSRADAPIQGQQDDQQPPGGFPVQVAFLDTNGNARVPKTDASGNIITIPGGTGTGATQVQGAAADGSAAVGNPVQIGGVDGGGLAQALLTDTSGRPQVVGGGADQTARAGINPHIIAGYDVSTTNLRAVYCRIASSDGDAPSSFVGLYTNSVPYLIGPTNAERGRTANAASGGTGTGLPGSGQMQIDGSLWQSVRTPSIFKTVTATAVGNTTVWTPAAGKKFRLMRYRIEITNNASLAAAGIETIQLTDGAGGTVIDAFSAFVNNAAATIMGAYTSEWMDLGNGYLSAAANNLLVVNLGTALATGVVRVTAVGTEE
jgi:hypothetical protein